MADNPFRIASLASKDGPPSPEAAPAEDNPFRIASLSKGGAAAPREQQGKLTEMYQKRVLDKLDTILPESIKKSRGGKYAAELAAHLAKFGPEAVDFATSPEGLGLMALHAVPQTRAFAGLIDVGLGLSQAPKAYRNIEKAYKNPTPENVGDAFLETAITVGGVAGGAEFTRRGARRMLGKTAAAPAAVAPKQTQTAVGAWPPTPKSFLRSMAERFAGISPEQRMRDVAANTWRARFAQGEREMGIAQEALRKEHERIAGNAPGQNYEILDAIERQETTPGFRQPDPRNQPLADMLESISRAEWDKVIALNIPGLDRHFYEHYAPHIARDPAKAQGFIQEWYNRRPMSGSEAFRRGRAIDPTTGQLKYPTIKDMRDAGIEMVTDNPIELYLLKLQEVKKFRIAHEVLNDFYDRNLIRYKPIDHRMPQGWRPIDDKLFRVGPRGIKGDLIAPEPVARVVETRLSPGLKAVLNSPQVPRIVGEVATPVVNLVRGYNANTNVANVALSGFHGELEAGVSMLNDASLALKYAVKGEPVRAARALAGSMGWAPPRDFVKGGDFVRQYFHPDEHPELEPLMQMFIEGGGRLRHPGRIIKGDWDYRGHLIDQFFDGMEKATPKNLRLAPKSLRRVFNFTMEDLVPRMKTNAAMRMAQFELEHGYQQKTLDEQRAIMAKVVDAVDDRHGQMIMENLGWNNLTKDLGYLTFRFLQWTFGSLRAGAGGVLDIARQPVRVALGESPELTHRAAWMMMLPFVYGTYNAIYQKLMTGENPKELRDLVFPKNGRKRPDGTPERDMLPLTGYLKDYWEWTHRSGDTAMHKFSNTINRAYSLWMNADQFDREIVDWDSHDIPKEMAQFTRYLIEAGEPISAQTLARESGERGELDLREVGRAALGHRTSPVYAMQSEAQNLIQKYSLKHYAKGPVPQEQFERRQAAATLLRRLENHLGKMDEVDRAYQEGKITAGDRAKVIRQSHLDPWSRQGRWGAAFSRLTPQEALHVWRAATGDERQKLAPVLLQQLTHLNQVLNPQEREQLRQEIIAAHQSAAPPPGVQ